MNTSDKGDSSVTRKVKNDYNTLNDTEFFAKYHVSKNRYRKRVNKYGDPYMNSPLAKLGKKLAENERTQKQLSINFDRIMRKAGSNKYISIDKQESNNKKVKSAMNALSADGYKIRYIVAEDRYEVYR